MSVVVKTEWGIDDVYDIGDSWMSASDGNLAVLDSEGEQIAEYAFGSWARVTLGKDDA